jgi:cAMP and cAMP-inhibited cGMP 3',5'-cyclic phosphodiesterase 10
MPQYILYMIFQLISVSEIDVKCLMKFILTARKFYRDIPYHNFEHAFNVCHCMYVILKRNFEKFSKLEVKALLIACVCHDIDHVGLTNNFLQLIRDDLALLYETSILENHHWQTTHMLLKDYDIFTNFTEQTTKLFYQEIHKAILATDLALYFESRVRLIRLYNSKTFSWVDHSHRDIIKSIMMNTCDLSGQCKPFLAARRITDCLYR